MAPFHANGVLRSSLKGQMIAKPQNSGARLPYSGAKRHRKILRDNIKGITKPAIRRIARRGGVKRISASIYRDIRRVLRNYLEQILGRVAAIVVGMCNRKIARVTDVIFVLNGLGRTIYGFDPR